MFVYTMWFGVKRERRRRQQQQQKTVTRKKDRSKQRKHKDQERSKETRKAKILTARNLIDSRQTVYKAVTETRIIQTVRLRAALGLAGRACCKHNTREVNIHENCTVRINSDNGGASQLVS